MRKILAVGSDLANLRAIEDQLGCHRVTDRCTLVCTHPDKALALIQTSVFDLVIISDCIAAARRAELLLEIAIGLRCPVVLYSPQAPRIEEDLVTRVLRYLPQDAHV